MGKPNFSDEFKRDAVVCCAAMKVRQQRQSR